ncbi:hypothetical protein JXE04_00125 [Patescibacteria group bacterium]|nr:hypothetical protein [Patescibacteria group bacterium]
MNKLTLSVGALAIMGIIALSANSVLAYQGDPSVQGPNYTAERHTAMTEAFTNADYEAWKNLMNGNGRVSQVINQDNFAKFAEAHQLNLEGKTAEAQAIRQELGLGLNNGSGAKHGLRNGSGNTNRTSGVRGVNR